MTDPAGALADALAAARLLAIDPVGLGGIWLRSGGPAEQIVTGYLAASSRLRRLPLHVDEDRLSGGVDVAASLAAGRLVTRAGLLAEARGSLLALPSAERISVATAGRIAAAQDQSGGFALLLLDEGIGPDERPPAILTERVAFHADLSEVRVLDAPPFAPTPGALAVEPVDEAILEALAKAAFMLGVDSARAQLFALRAARAAAAADGRTRIEPEDAALAARLVLAPRATRLPQAEPEATPPDQDEREPEPAGLDKLEDLVLAAARTALPADLLNVAGEARRGPAPRTRGAGEKRRSGTGGRPLGARPGLPRGGARLALIDTLRAAAPWQRLRGAQAGERLRLRSDDLRIRRFEDRAETLTIFAVDASGSAAAARLAEAKGAVEILLGRAYAERAEVALVAFRGTSAEILLPPTRSLTRARRLLAELPGGGGTPLAAGLDAARALADAARQRGRTASLVLLTDGRANVAADGTADRARAGAEADAAARRIALAGFAGAVIDTGTRPQPEAARIAAAMAARYFHLPRADAAAVEAVLAA